MADTPRPADVRARTLIAGRLLRGLAGARWESLDDGIDVMNEAASLIVDDLAAAGLLATSPAIPEACDGGADPTLNHERHPWPCGDATALATPPADVTEQAREEAERRLVGFSAVARREAFVAGAEWAAARHTSEAEAGALALDEAARVEAEMFDWLDGRQSWTNLGPNAPYTPDVIAVMDAQEVVKRAAALAALRAGGAK